MSLLMYSEFNLIYYKYIWKCFTNVSDNFTHLPFTKDFLLRIPQTWRNSPGAKLLFTPEQQGREVEHSLGALRTTPHTYYGCCTLSGLPSESKPLPHGL